MIVGLTFGQAFSSFVDAMMFGPELTVCSIAGFKNWFPRVVASTSLFWSNIEMNKMFSVMRRHHLDECFDIYIRITRVHNLNNRLLSNLLFTNILNVLTIFNELISISQH